MGLSTDWILILIINALLFTSYLEIILDFPASVRRFRLLFFEWNIGPPMRTYSSTPYHYCFDTKVGRIYLNESREMTVWHINKDGLTDDLVVSSFKAGILGYSYQYFFKKRLLDHLEKWRTHDILAGKGDLYTDARVQGR